MRKDHLATVSSDDQGRTRLDAPAPAVPTPVRFTPFEHDDYLAAFESLELAGFVLAPAARPWGFARVRLSSCVVEHGSDAAPWSARGTTAAGVVTFAFAAGPEAELRVGGRGTGRNELHLWPGGTRVSLVSRRPAGWFVVTVPEADFAPGPGPRAGVTAGPRPVPDDELARVRALARAALRLEEGGLRGTAPDDLRGIEAALLAGIARLAGHGRAERTGGAHRVDRRAVLERVDELFASRRADPIYVADLCEATGLPERTLRYVLVAEYGTSPVRLVRNVRLCALRRSLRDGTSRQRSLARVAADHGFRHMGTLAADYRRLFGELPSETRRSTVPCPPEGAPGLHAAG